MYKLVWVLCGFLCLNVVPAGAGQLDSFLPASGELAGWTTYQRPQDEDDLFWLIDGAGQVYIDHGFQEAVFQKYSDASFIELNLEIYDQGASAKAESTFHDPSLEIGWEVPQEGFGVEGRVDTMALGSYRAEFWRERYFVRGTILQKDSYAWQILTSFCLLVDQKLIDGTVVDGLPASGDITGWNCYRWAVDSLGLQSLLGSEADLFSEWGCSAGLEQTYYDSEFVLLQIELFDLGTPACAQSLYHDARLETGQEIARDDFGQEGRVDTTSSWTYGAQFWRDRYVARLLIQERSDSSLADLIRFCRLVDQKIGATSIEREGSSTTPRPSHGELLQSFPNPFNDQALVRYRIPKAWEGLGTYGLDIYNVEGQQVRRLIGNQIPIEGFHSLFWDGCDDRGTLAASGVYFCRLCCGPHRRVTKMMLIR